MNMVREIEKYVLISIFGVISFIGKNVFLLLCFYFISYENYKHCSHDTNLLFSSVLNIFTIDIFDVY